MIKTLMTGSLFVIGSTIVAGAVFAPSAAALTGPHTYTNGTTGDVFLGGDYIELGISKRGSFGTSTGQAKPSGFFGAGSRTNLGMSTNPTGFGVAPDLRMDYFLPGSPEERWAIGYKESSSPSTGSNSLLRSANSIPDNTVVDQSSGSTLKAQSEGTFNSKLKTTQIVSFERGDKFFKNEVTLTNVGTGALDSVRFMRSFDPDNTVDQGGDYTTHITVPYTQAAGDGKAVVIADTNVSGNTDPVFTSNGSYSPILFYSSDSRARVSAFGFSNNNVYASDAYDSAPAKGYSTDDDIAVTITFDVGTLAPGASQTVVYYTSLDNRDFSEVLEDIASSEDDNDNVSAAVEDAAPNSGDGNGDGTVDSEQPNVTSLLNPVAGSSKYETVETDGCDAITSISVNPSATYGTDSGYDYPLGLTDFTIDCTNPGDTTTIKVFYDKTYDTSKWTPRKYIDGTFRTITGATFGTATVGSATVTTMTYQVTDGGVLDDDGTANGTIVDPAGPGAVLAASTAEAPNTGLAPHNPSTMYGLLLAGAAFITYGIRTRKISSKK